MIYCPEIIGSRGACNTPLTMTPEGARCLRCEARDAGRCWNCGKPRTNHPTKGVLCPPCVLAARKIADKRYITSPKGKSARARVDANRQTDEMRAKRAAYLREWRRNNPVKAKEHQARWIESRKAA